MGEPHWFMAYSRALQRVGEAACRRKWYAWQEALEIKASLLVHAFWHETDVDLMMESIKRCWNPTPRMLHHQRDNGPTAHVISYIDELAVCVPTSEAWDKMVWPTMVAIPWVPIKAESYSYCQGQVVDLGPMMPATQFHVTNKRGTYLCTTRALGRQSPSPRTLMLHLHVATRHLAKALAMPSAPDVSGVSSSCHWTSSSLYTLGHHLQPPLCPPVGVNFLQGLGLLLTNVHPGNQLPCQTSPEASICLVAGSSMFHAVQRSETEDFICHHQFLINPPMVFYLNIDVEGLIQGREQHFWSVALLHDILMP